MDWIPASETTPAGDYVSTHRANESSLWFWVSILTLEPHSQSHNWLSVRRSIPIRSPNHN